ncbi:MAG: histidine kinase [Acidithiobacillus sp.]|uniref:histidine kinase n=1 Tax=Acidithiobacillus sp. TaxID=1872118 RepID=UPI003CFED122
MGRAPLRPVGTGLAIGPQAPQELLRRALAQALAKLAGQPVSATLCLFSPSLARIAPDAIRQVMRQLSCLRLLVATVPGVITEEGYALGENACAVLLLAPPLGLSPVTAQVQGQTILSMARLEQCRDAWLQRVPRMGFLSGRGTRFWQNAQPVPGPCEALVEGATCLQVAYSPGMRPLNAPLAVSLQEGNLLLRLERYSALPLLAQSLPFSIREEARLPLERLLVGELRPGQSSAVPPQWINIRATDLNRSGLWLERCLAADARAFFALRDPQVAQRDTRMALGAARAGQPAPDFAWVSSSVGRDAAFFSGSDRDHALWQEFFPGVPCIGAYDLAEIAPMQDENRVLRYSKAFYLFSAQTECA